MNSLTVRVTKERIEILMCAPREPIRVISAIAASQIHSLNSLYPKENRVFIYRGRVLDQSRTFDSYHVHNQETIIALPQTISSNKDKFQKWLDVSQDGDDFREHIQMLMNPSTILEASKINDLHLTKLLQKPKIFQKIVKSYQNEDTSQSSGSRNEVNVEPLTAPSTEALPVFW